MRRHSSTVSRHTPNAYLSRSDAVELKCYAFGLVHELSKRLDRALLHIARDQIKLRDSVEQFKSDLVSGDIAACSYRLRRLHAAGAFVDEGAAICFALDSLCNLLAPQRGARRTDSTKSIMKVMQMWWGPACVAFLHLNSGLGGGISVERWLKADRRPFKLGLHEENFISAVAIILAAMTTNDITGPIICFM